MRNPFRRVVGLLIILVAAAAGCNTPNARDREARGASSSRTPRELNLILMGDWGAHNEEQRQVAQAMAEYVRGSGKRFDAALCVGDNFYVKLKGVDDPQWQTVFEQMYDPEVLDFPFYTVPGNHDYDDGKLAIELAYSKQNPDSRFRMPSNYYRLELPGREPLLTVFMLDSDKTPMGESAWAKQMDWLRGQVARPRQAPWQLAVAHHPIFSNGDHGDVGVLQTTWGPLFTQYGLDLYVAGHDHDLQHLQVDGWPYSFVLVGGGGAKTRVMRVDKRGPFSKRSHGFGHATITEDKITVRLIDEQGQVLHEFERDRAGDVRVVRTSASDVAVPRTRRSVARPDLEDRATTTTTSPTTNPTTAPSPTGTPD